jgi:hypothetical protein
MVALAVKYALPTKVTPATSSAAPPANPCLASIISFCTTIYFPQSCLKKPRKAVAYLQAVLCPAILAHCPLHDRTTSLLVEFATEMGQQRFLNSSPTRVALQPADRLCLFDLFNALHLANRILTLKCSVPVRDFKEQGKGLCRLGRPVDLRDGDARPDGIYLNT